eukprot:scaffold85186_cov15-Tisochrysis_lutea.AAC.1
MVTREVAIRAMAVVTMATRAVVPTRASATSPLVAAGGNAASFLGGPQSFAKPLSPKYGAPSAVCYPHMHSPCVPSSFQPPVYICALA